MEWWQDLYDDLRLKTAFGSDNRRADLSKEISFIQDVLALPERGTVLDLCCGTGRHSVALALRGYGVTGVDLSRDYLERARRTASEQGVEVSFVEKDVRKLSFEGQFDAAINMGMSFGYFSDRENLRVIQNVANSVKKGGRFLMELMNRDWLIRNFTSRDWREVKGTLMLQERDYDFATSRVRGTVTYIEGPERIEKELDWRLYSFHELRSMLETSGLKPVAAYGTLDKDEISFRTRMMRIVSEKAE